MKTRREYRKELIALDKELYELQERIEGLKQEFIKEYGISEWDEMFDYIYHAF